MEKSYHKKTQHSSYLEKVLGVLHEKLFSFLAAFLLRLSLRRRLLGLLRLLRSHKKMEEKIKLNFYFTLEYCAVKSSEK